jgi:leucyl aminopeptidase
MEITVDSQPIEKIESEALVTYAFEQEKPVEGALAGLDAAVGGALSKLAASGEFTGKLLEVTLLHFPQGLAAQRLLVMGAGKKGKFDNPILRKLAGAAARTLKARKVKRIIFLAREDERNTISAQAITEGAILADFESDTYKTDKKAGTEIASFALAGWDAVSRAAAEQGIERGRIIAESQNFARALGNEPSNFLTPRMLADRAEAMARESGLAVQVLDEKQIADLKMGALLSVARGSAEPPRLMVVTYTPEKLVPGAPVLGLVGKAVTFDTGGISLKQSKDMDQMKYDMCGGAAVLGTLRALARLKPVCKVIAVVPSTENMPGGRAQKPGDVQIAMSGKSIEVLNTDAEGRLILADGITYAKQLGCTHLVDVATLTGAIITTFSDINTGVFGSDQVFTDRLLASARAVGEKMWQLPMDEEYHDMIKGTVGDIRNQASGTGGGSITAAWFLREFSGDMPWIHLDIAGTDSYHDNKPWAARGAVGVAVRTLVNLAEKFSEQATLTS